MKSKCGLIIFIWLIIPIESGTYNNEKKKTLYNITLYAWPIKGCSYVFASSITRL